jgi:hypothetical protein
MGGTGMFSSRVKLGADSSLAKSLSSRMCTTRVNGTENAGGVTGTSVTTTSNVPV